MSEIAVLLPVYKNDDPILFASALDSIFTQSYQEFDLIIVQDGPVDVRIADIIEDAVKDKDNVKTIVLEENVGLVKALNFALHNLHHKIIIRCDADDYNYPDRFKVMVEYYLAKDLKLLGAQILEENSDTHEQTKKILPCDLDRIRSFALFRNPINHMACMFDRKTALELGGYPDLLFKEDYGLWLKFLKVTDKIANLPDYLVKATTSNAFYLRRSGKRHFKSEIDLYKLKLNLALWPSYLITTSFVVRSLIFFSPSSLIKRLYKSFLRK